MNCVCCDKEIFLKPKVSIVFDSETELPITVKKREFFYESDSFIEYEDVMIEDLENREKRVMIICDEKTMITKSFCEECYMSFVKDKIEDLIETLALFRNKK
jgi:hypothetical protein